MQPEVWNLASICRYRSTLSTISTATTKYDTSTVPALTVEAALVGELVVGARHEVGRERDHERLRRLRFTHWPYFACCSYPSIFCLHLYAPSHTFSSFSHLL